MTEIKLENVEQQELAIQTTMNSEDKNCNPCYPSICPPLTNKRNIKSNCVPDMPCPPM